MNSMQYSDNLCQAIEIIANNVVQGLNYDKTILCTITNIDKAKQGQYTVSDGSSTYIAYSSIKTYRLNTQVYVLIPNGDYNQQKMIVGDYSTSLSEDKGYSLPIDTIIPVEKLEYENSDTTFGLIANENKEKGSAIPVLSQTELKLGPQYTRLAIEGDFQTSFNQSVIDGNYGIVVLLSGKDENDNNITDQVYSFNCSDFFGNPYNFTAAVTQSVVFDISDFKKINTIKIQVQESGDFYNIEEKYLPVTFNKQGEPVPNIIINNLKFTFGFDINEYNNNDLLISSKNELTYDNEGQKDLLLNWVRQRNNKTLFGINSKIDISLNNYNYLRHLWRSSPDSGEDKLYYAGKTSNYISAYWYNYTLENIPTDSLLKEDLWKVSSYYNNQFYSSEELKDAFSDSSLFTFSFNPSIRNFREKVKIVIAISGCLSKKTLKTQEIEVDNKLLEVVLVQEMTEHGQIINKPEYEYMYYSPKDELIIEDIFNEEYSGLDEEQKPIKEKIPAYKQNTDGTYTRVNEEYQKVVVEWVQYYQKESLSIDDKGKVQLENNNKNKPIYSSSQFVYLTSNEFFNLNSQYYDNDKKEWNQNIEEVEGKIYKGYKLTLTPLVLFKSNEIVFENTDEGSYKRLNLINNIELKCLDELKGRYFIYGFDNTISSNMANNGGRRIQVSFNSINSEDVKSDNVKIQWKIPVNNTMILEPIEEELNSDYKEAFLTWSLDDEENPSYWISNEIAIENTASGSKDITDSLTMSIPYGIKEYYSPSLTNNTIICLIKKAVNEAEENDITINQAEFELLFGPSGTNGTSYTLTLNFEKQYKKEGNNFLLLSDERQSFLRRGDNLENNPWVKIEAHLYDGKNLVLDEVLPISFTWYVDPTYETGKTTVELDTAGGNKNYCYIRSSYDVNANSFSARQHCAILQGTINYQGKNLTTYLPIPICFYNNVYGFEGADKIIYNANGTNPNYYKNAHKIFRQNNKEITDYTVEYQICINRAYSTSLPIKEQQFYPKMIKNENNEWHLIPPGIFYSNTSKVISIRVENTATDGAIFMQPILILQNQFGNSMLNEWDGNLLIDEDNNRIMAAQIAAGTKDTNNTFTGVVMGAVEETVSDKSVTNHGLYGYHKGVLSFGFKDNGTAFLGKSGSGRIYFNGNEGIIESANYSENNIGAKLNLETGSFNLKSEGRGSIALSGIGSSDNPFLKITERANRVIHKATINNVEYSFYLFISSSSDDSNYFYGYSTKFLETYPNKLARFRKNNLVYDTMINAYHFSVGNNYTSLSWYTENNTDTDNKRVGKLYDQISQTDAIIFYAARGNYYLQSANYIDNIGMKIDLNTGHLTTQNTGGKILLQPTDPARLFRVESAEGKILINIGYGKANPTDTAAANYYYLRSINYNSTNKTGLNIDLGAGKITGYNFRIYAQKTGASGSDNHIDINSGATDYPLKITGDNGGDTCYIGWDGVLHATGASISGVITAISGSFNNCTIKNTCIIQKGLKIGLWSVGDYSLYYGSESFANNNAFLHPTGKSLTNFNTTQNWVLGIGSNFGVIRNGTVYCSNIIISGGSLNINNGTFKVTSTGALTATSATITGDIQSGSTISGAEITGGTIQTATSNSNQSRIIMNSSGELDFYYSGTYYGSITTTNTTTDKYWTFLGHLDSNWTSVTYRGITLGFDVGTWSGTATARYTLKATYHDFIRPIYIEDMWLKYGSSVTHVLQYDGDAVALSGGGLSLNLSVNNGFRIKAGRYTDLMTINEGFSDNQIHFQQPTHFGSTVYNSGGGVAFTSDRNAKNSILPLTENHEIFFNNLKPMIFKYNNGTSDRFHTGFIAQDVLAAIETCGLTTQDIGAYIQHEVMLTNGGYVEQALRYDEFIALNTHMIQKCLKRIDELENEIKNLKAQL